MILLLGGARSGKSDLARSLVEGGNVTVTFLATGTEVDEEMARRIDGHRRSRPAEWSTVEEPVDLAGAIREVPAGDALLIDCLTLWVSNLLEARSDEQILEAAEDAAEAAAGRIGRTVVVSNEVGSGLVPMHPVGRRFRDVQGGVNRVWAVRASEAFLVVAGRLLPLMSAEDAI